MEWSTEGKTLQYQDHLPMLTLPPLEASCSRYLKAVEPYISAEELETTKSVVSKFLNGIGKQLQQKLEHLTIGKQSWINDFIYSWYTSVRGPLPIFRNPVGHRILPREVFTPKPGKQTQMAALTAHIVTSLYLKLADQTFEVDVFKKGIPADMEQYYNIFCSGRNPGVPRDTLENYFIPGPGGIETNGIRHIVVIYKYRFYKVDVLSEDFEPLTPPEIERQLLILKRDADAKPSAPGVGIFTTWDRVSWSRARDHLCSLSPRNSSIIKEIHKAIFVLALDTCNPETSTEILRESLAGDGANRWYDKGKTIIVTNNGILSIMYEHSHCDGTILTGIGQRFHNMAMETGYEWKGSPDVVRVHEPFELDFAVDKTTTDMIRQAEDQYQIIQKAVAIRSDSFPGYGKSFMKKHRIRPNGYFEIVLELAFMKVHGRFPTGLAIATLRMFRGGRTELARTGTIEMLEFSNALSNPHLSAKEKILLLHKACKTHEQVYMDAILGKGFDYHLLHLQTIAQEEGIPTPEIFTDPAWIKGGNDLAFDIVSSISGYLPSLGALAPKYKDGYQVVFSIVDESIHFCITSLVASEVTDIQLFGDAIIESLLEIHRLFMFSSL